MSDEWRPSIQVSTVKSPREFAVAVYDPTIGGGPFTIILTYNAKYSQPWSRYDIPAYAVDLKATHYMSSLHDPEADYVALGEEGELYFVGGQSDNGVRRIIPPMTDVTKDNVELRFGKFLPTSRYGAIISGDAVLSNNGDGWEDITPSTEHSPPYGAATWSAFVATNGDLYAAAEQRPSLSEIWVRPGDAEWYEGISYEDIFQIEQRRSAELTSREPRFGLFARTNDGWLTVEGEPRSLPQSMYSDGTKIWLVGSGGMILHGDRSNVVDVAFAGDREKFLVGITRHDSQFVIASDRSLFHFDRHVLEPFEPKVRVTSEPYALSPNHVESVDGVLMLFDYNRRIHRFSNSEWSEVPIPPELFEQEFEGLQ